MAFGVGIIEVVILAVVGTLCFVVPVAVIVILMASGGGKGREE